MTKITLQKNGNNIYLYDGDHKLTTFTGVKMDDVVTWINKNLKNVQISLRGDGLR